MIGLGIAGLFFLGLNLKISLLSHQFIFGMGQKERPIIQFLFYILGSFVVYLISLRWLKRIQPDRHTRNFVLLMIVFVSIAARLMYFPSQLIQETDPYRYIWDGQAVAQGTNPYQYSPEYSFSHDLKPVINDRATVTGIYRKINHPGVPTIYPPLAQILFAVSQWLTPWSLTGWRTMIFAAECLILFVLIKILLKLKLPAEGVMLYGWSPLILKEFSNSLHLDVFAVLFLTVMIYALAKKWWMAAFFSLALATLVKLFSIILLPLLILYAYKKKRPVVLRGAGLFAFMLIVTHLPFLSAGVSVWEGLRRFGFEWEVNSSLFGMIKWVIQMFPLSKESIEMASRVCAMTIFTGLASWVFSRVMRQGGGLSSFFKAGVFLLSFLFFLIPAGNPWYFTWLFPFLIFFPARALIIFSGLVFLYYLDFYFMYQNQRNLFAGARWAEYGLFFMILGWELWIKNRPLRLKSREQGRNYHSSIEERTTLS